MLICPKVKQLLFCSTLLQTDININIKKSYLLTDTLMSELILPKSCCILWTGLLQVDCELELLVLLYIFHHTISEVDL